MFTVTTRNLLQTSIRNKNGNCRSIFYLNAESSVIKHQWMFDTYFERNDFQYPIL